jgi:hypothetical protein
MLYRKGSYRAEAFTQIAEQVRSVAEKLLSR